MILDSSAIISAITNEHDGDSFREAIYRSATLTISAVTALEIRIVLHARYGADLVTAFERVLRSAGIAVIPFDAGLAEVAFDAFRRYGKGQAQPAQLNIADCAAYALAKTRSEPLLFKGVDFSQTDIAAAL